MAEEAFSEENWRMTCPPFRSVLSILDSRLTLLVRIFASFVTSHSAACETQREFEFDHVQPHAIVVRRTGKWKERRLSSHTTRSRSISQMEQGFIPLRCPSALTGTETVPLGPWQVRVLPSPTRSSLPMFRWIGPRGTGNYTRARSSSATRLIFCSSSGLLKYSS